MHYNILIDPHTTFKYYKAVGINVKKEWFHEICLDKKVGKGDFVLTNSSLPLHRQKFYQINI